MCVVIIIASHFHVRLHSCFLYVKRARGSSVILPEIPLSASGGLRRYYPRFIIPHFHSKKYSNNPKEYFSLPSRIVHKGLLFRFAEDCYHVGRRRKTLNGVRHVETFKVPRRAIVKLTL